jgi:hypothetical protein
MPLTRPRLPTLPPRRMGAVEPALTWLETHSRWSQLRALGQSNLVRASVLMPVLGILLLFNETVQQYLTIRYDPSWPFNYLPSMWRIWMLYYGGCVLAVASLVFSWRCPAEIKQYASSFMMADAERHHYTSHRLTDIISKRLNDLYSGLSTREESITKTFASPRLKPDQPNLGVGSSPDLQSGDQWGLGLIRIWELNDIKRPKTRIAVYLLFRAGLVLVSIPAIVTFVQVTLIAVRHF